VVEGHQDRLTAAALAGVLVALLALVGAPATADAQTATLPPAVADNMDAVTQLAARDGLISPAAGNSLDCGTVCDDLYLAEHRPMPNQPASDELWAEFNRLQRRSRLLPALRLLGNVTLAAGAFSTGWAIGTELRRIFVKVDVPVNPVASPNGGWDGHMVAMVDRGDPLVLPHTDPAELAPGFVAAPERGVVAMLDSAAAVELMSTSSEYQNGMQPDGWGPVRCGIGYSQTGNAGQQVVAAPSPYLPPATGWGVPIISSGECPIGSYVDVPHGSATKTEILTEQTYFRPKAVRQHPPKVWDPNSEDEIERGAVTLPYTAPSRSGADVQTAVQTELQTHPQDYTTLVPWLNKQLGGAVVDAPFPEETGDPETDPATDPGGDPGGDPAPGEVFDPNRPKPATELPGCGPNVPAIDLDPLKVAIGDKFPFAVPGWTLGILQSWVSDAQAPRFRVPFPFADPDPIIDMGWWDDAMPIWRGTMLFVSFIGLAWAFLGMALGFGRGDD
jgi:hypothetical protein